MVQLHSQIADSALQLGVPEQQLAGSEIARLAIEHGNFGASQTVRAVLGWLEADERNPPLQQADILPRRKVCATVRQTIAMRLRRNR